MQEPLHPSFVHRGDSCFHRYCQTISWLSNLKLMLSSSATR